MFSIANIEIKSVGPPVLYLSEGSEGARLGHADSHNLVLGRSDERVSPPVLLEGPQVVPVRHGDEVAGTEVSLQQQLTSQLSNET